MSYPTELFHGDSGRQLSKEEWTDLYRRHDQFMV